MGYNWVGFPKKEKSFSVVSLIRVVSIHCLKPNPTITCKGKKERKKKKRQGKAIEKSELRLLLRQKKWQKIFFLYVFFFFRYLFNYTLLAPFPMKITELTPVFFISQIFWGFKVPQSDFSWPFYDAHFFPEEINENIFVKRENFAISPCMKKNRKPSITCIYNQYFSQSFKSEASPKSDACDWTKNIWDLKVFPASSESISK